MKAMTLFSLALIVVSRAALAGGILSSSKAPAAAPAVVDGCADFTGEWNGTCQVGGSPIAQKLTLMQVKCEKLLLVEGDASPVAFLFGKGISVSATLSSPAMIYQASWLNQNTRAVLVAASTYQDTLMGDVVELTRSDAQLSLVEYDLTTREPVGQCTFQQTR